jgi:hypothetical protein
MKRRALRALAGAGFASLVVALLALAVRRRSVQAAPDEQDEASARLAAFEAEQHRTTDFSKLAPYNLSSGPDPYLLRALGPAHAVGILRGGNALVLLDASLHELQRVAAPPSPTALAVSDRGEVLVAGELAPFVARYTFQSDALVPSGTFDVGVRAIRGIASGPHGWIYVVEEHDGRLVAAQLAKDGHLSHRTAMSIGAGPSAVERVGDHLVVNCVLDHALAIQGLDASGAPTSDPPIRIVHDGPFWSFAASPRPNGLIIAAGGVEDHPLDRTVGAFGYVDSFLYLYDVDVDERSATRRTLVNLSELGIVTPKSIVLHADPRLEVTVTGYGSDHRVDLTFEDRSPRVATKSFLPGASSVVELAGGALAFADPLFDAWLLDAPGRELEVVDVAGPSGERDPLVRLGEGLFYTTLMAPWNQSDGPLSRFTCETCHFEGYVDGRTHHTGRGDVHAVTKPLLGLFNNRPHFSRALDPDLVSVAFNEFRVAGAKSGHDPWFALTTDAYPWLSRLFPGQASFSPETLRKALMAFLMSFNHRQNPSTFERSRWSDEERAGAGVFRDRCESCHEARLVADEPKTRVPYERWEELVMTPAAPIVWGKAEYKKTGVVPYVHENGARVPSLRRLYKKRPYFTNGSAKTLDEVLARARFSGDGLGRAGSGASADGPDPGRAASAASADGFSHVPSSASGEALDEAQRAVLLRFLDLL